MNITETTRDQIVLKRLLKITDGCGEDMHEPDNQGLECKAVVGDHLDNACGDHIGAEQIAGRYQEYVVCLERGSCRTIREAGGLSMSASIWPT